MKVHELIRILKQFPSNYEAIMDTEDGKIDEIEQVVFDTIGRKVILSNLISNDSTKFNTKQSGV